MYRAIQAALVIAFLLISPRVFAAGTQSTQAEPEWKYNGANEGPGGARVYRAAPIDSPFSDGGVTPLERRRERLREARRAERDGEDRAEREKEVREEIPIEQQQENQ